MNCRIIVGWMEITAAGWRMRGKLRKHRYTRRLCMRYHQV